MVNELGWSNLAERKRDTHLTLFYMIGNHEVNVPFEDILILANEGTRKRQAHNNFMHKASNIDDNKYYFYH